MNNKFVKEVTAYMMMTVGACIAAFAIEEFLVPCTILDGGIVGISIMISSLTGISLSLLTIVLNIPFLIVGFKRLGHGFIIKSAYAMVVFAAFIRIFEEMDNATDDYILAVSFGGVLLGLGVGLVIKAGGCLDGTETVAIMLNRKYHFQVGQIILAFNVIIYATAGVLFGFERAMYSLLTYFITSKVLDIVETGINQAKAAMIITDRADDIAGRIYERLGRTVTIMEGEGLVSGKKVVLYCVLTRFEIRELREIIEGLDSSAFITISDVSEIIGTHIKSSSGGKEETVSKEA